MALGFLATFLRAAASIASLTTAASASASASYMYCMYFACLYIQYIHTCVCIQDIHTHTHTHTHTQYNKTSLDLASALGGHTGGGRIQQHRSLSCTSSFGAPWLRTSTASQTSRKSIHICYTYKPAKTQGISTLRCDTCVSEAALEKARYRIPEYIESTCSIESSSTSEKARNICYIERHIFFFTREIARYPNRLESKPPNHPPPTHPAVAPPPPPPQALPLLY